MANKPRYRVMEKPAVAVRRPRSASERGYDSRWSRHIAPGVRDRDQNLCRMCVAEGGVAMAVEAMIRQRHAMIVDHIVPAHVIGEDRFYDESNLQVLCARHHAAKTAEDMKLYGAARR